MRLQLEHAAEARLTRVQSNLVGPWVWFPDTSPITNMQNSRLLRVRRVTLPLAAGRGDAELRFRTAQDVFGDETLTPI
jgi:hypothetical protein